MQGIESLVYDDISSDKKTINLYIDEDPLGCTALYLEYYWGLFPKFEGDKLICNRKVSTKEIEIYR